MSLYFPTNLRYLREKAGMEQIELARTLGYKSSSGVSEWESGKRIPSSGILADIAGIMGVSLDDLMNKDLRPVYDEKTLDKEMLVSYRSARKLPILGNIAAGLPILAEDNIEGYFTIDYIVNATFILRVKGMSMIGAGIIDGDLAFIRKQPTVENGEIAAVMIDNDEATLKRVYFENGSIRLVSENPEFKTKVYTKGDVRIIGKLVAVLDIL
ncbi:transcriptional repressor LexA [Gudongella sp. SC589]|uniref:transcriptional repressor LexA n=1 Tax=Gudongella sp. SC589 TaxID=3385990 RepID=UPI0039047D6F